MPASYKMSWEPKARRWWKQYKGRRHVISCRQLHAPETKEASYRAANAWWVAKQAEVDGQQPPHPHADYLAELADRRAWARRHGQPEIASRLSEEIARIEQGGVPVFMPEYFEAMAFEPPSPDSYTDEMPPLEVLERRYLEDQAGKALDPRDPVWNDRIAHEKAEPVPEERRVGRLVEEWLSFRKARVYLGGLTPKSFDNTVDRLGCFRDWIGPDEVVSALDAMRWEAYWLHLSEKVRDRVWSPDHAAAVFRVARTFVAWLSDRDLIPAPKNLGSRDFRFVRAPKPVATMTVAEVRKLVGCATGQLPLHLLLMANCGMTQQDIADLRQGEVDWPGGRIIRKRSKTGGHQDVPTVNYKLWPGTWDLLRRHRAPEGDLVLLTRSRRPWVHAQLVDGKLKTADNFASNYAHLRRKLGFEKPAKLIRKTSASLLDEEPEFARYVGHFLGHSPRTVRDRHYVSPSRDRFDEAVEWLGKRYGFLDE